MADEEFNVDNEGFLQTNDAVDHYYTKLMEYYNLQMESIGPEEYAFLKQTLGYPETYEEHMESLKKSLKPENETKKYINDFLETYCEFKHQAYILIWGYINDTIMKNPQHVKEMAKNALLQCNDLKDNEDTPVSSSSIPDTIQMPLPNGIEIELPTYNDPLMVCMYSVCFMAASARFDYNVQDTTQTTQLL